MSYGCTSLPLTTEINNKKQDSCNHASHSSVITEFVSHFCWVPRQKKKHNSLGKPLLFMVFQKMKLCNNVKHRIVARLQVSHQKWKWTNRKSAPLLMNWEASQHKLNIPECMLLHHTSHVCLHTSADSLSPSYVDYDSATTIPSNFNKFRPRTITNLSLTH